MPIMNEDEAPGRKFVIAREFVEKLDAVRVFAFLGSIPVTTESLRLTSNLDAPTEVKAAVFGAIVLGEIALNLGLRRLSISKHAEMDRLERESDDFNAAQYAERERLNPPPPGYKRVSDGYLGSFDIPIDQTAPFV